MDADLHLAHFRMVIGGIMAFLTVITLDQWVAIATLIYFLLQIGLLFPKYYTIFMNLLRKNKATVPDAPTGE